MADHTETLTATPELTIPPDMWVDLTGLNPNSHEFKQDFEALNALAREVGSRAITLSDIFPTEEIEPPQGFRSETALPFPSAISIDQFKNNIISFSKDAGETVEVGVHALTTDMGSKLAYCDLRPFMTSSVREGGPGEKQEKAALDRAVMNDLKFFADNGHARKTVTSAKGVNYSAVGGTKIRGYWASVMPETPIGMPLVARIADCGNSVRAESDLYRRVFGKLL